MQRTVRLLPLFFATALILGGCGRSYRLPGHGDANLRDPPDVTMRVGQRRKAVSTGFTIKAMGPARMESTDPDIVAVEVEDGWNTVYLRAQKPGVATVRYLLSSVARADDPANDGFEVRVVRAR